MNFSGRAFGLLTILIVFFAVLPAAGLTQGDGGPEFRSDDIVKSTVRVVVYDSGHRRLGWGTGWIISASDFDKRAGNAIVVTTWNTIAKAAVGGYVQIIPGGGGPELPARVRSTSNETKIDFDLAFIEVKGLTAPALPVADTAPDSARPVYSSGYSFVADTNEASQWSSRASIQSGTVSKTFQGGMTRASQAPVDQIEHNTPLDPGYSGGPLLDRCGRVVGVNTKDGGIRIGEDVPVALSRGSRFALASNELISIANQEGVPFVPGHGDCSSSATPAATTAPSLPVAAPPPVQASPIQSTGDFFRANPIALGALVLAGLVALGFAVWLIMRGRRDNRPSVAPAATAPTSAPTAAGTRPAPSARTTATAPVIELAGRGPDGAALNLRFSADELGGAGAILGSDPRAAGVIDNRSDYKVSRTHARLGFDGRNFTLEDMKSSNGTKVSGAKLEPNKPHVLVSGDDIELADVNLRVSVR